MTASWQQGATRSLIFSGERRVTLPFIFSFFILHRKPGLRQGLSDWQSISRTHQGIDIVPRTPVAFPPGQLDEGFPDP